MYLKVYDIEKNINCFVAIVLPDECLTLQEIVHSCIPRLVNSFNTCHINF